MDGARQLWSFTRYPWGTRQISCPDHNGAKNLIKHFVHTKHHLCVNVSSNTSNIASNTLITGASTAVVLLVLLYVIVSTKLNISVPDSTSCQILSRISKITNMKSNQIVFAIVSNICKKKCARIGFTMVPRRGYHAHNVP